MAERDSIGIWPCPACGAANLAEGWYKCLEDTDHGDCAHNVLETPCPNDDLFDGDER